MKQTAFLSLLAVIAFTFIACQKEYSRENIIAVSSAGTLKTLSGDCLPSTVGGSFTPGAKPDSSNFIDVNIDVTKVGSYLVVSDTVNGFYFKATGVFTAIGMKTVRLLASGTPLTQGTPQFTIIYNTSICTVDVPVTSGSVSAAVFTFKTGTDGTCTGATLNGTYRTAVAMASSNTARIDVDVSAAGTYNISTAAVNGVVFAGSGTFIGAGPQQVILSATGTPVTSGNFNFAPAINASTCGFALAFLPAAQPAVFSLTGEPGNCSNAVINGTYTSQQSTNSTNTVIIKVDVTTAGGYSITTNSVNGLSFSGSGVFASAGTAISVTLTAAGIPIAAGTDAFTPQAGSSACTFNIVTVGAPTGTLTCKIDGLFTTFNDRASAQLDQLGTPDLHLEGYTAPPNGGNIPELQLFITNNDASAVKPGSYNVDGLLSLNGYRIEVDYHAVNPDLSVTIWNTSSTFFTPNPPFTIIVTSITATRVRGTFSGKVTNIFQGSTIQKTLSEGVFDLPVK